jgi:hypothetical protein
MGERRGVYRVLVREINHLEDQSVDEKIILNLWHPSFTFKF